MQDITSTVQDISIRTAVAVQNLYARMRDEERGQTAVEYAGILALIAVIFAALFLADIDGKIAKKVGPAVDNILKGD
jgi:Flp pilus assembly pilin Flp